MRAANYYGGKNLRIEEIPDPVPAPTEVKVKVTTTGICGSDLHGYREEYPAMDMPAQVMGHELVGVVESLGSEVNNGLSVGDRIGINPLVGCGHCERCRAGMSYLCFNGETIGIHRSGGFAEYTCAPQQNCYRLPENVSDEAGALLDVYGCALHGLTRAPVKPGDRVVVIGTGSMAIAFAELARLSGAGAVAIVGRRKKAAEKAAEIAGAVPLDTEGRDPVDAVNDWTNNRGAELVYECVGGTDQTLSMAMQMAAQGGVIGVEGVHMRSQSIDSTTALLRELTVTWFYSHGRRGERAEYEIALDLMAQGRIQPERLVTHHFPLEQITQAFAVASDHLFTGSIKVLVNP